MAEFGYIIKQKFKSSFDSLKNTSYDKENKTYMCQSDMQVVDFDKLTLELNPLKQPSSYDSLIIEELNKKVFCVEFKNQNRADVKNQNLHKKVKDSDNTFKKICVDNNVKKDNYNFIFCVVYKSNPSTYRYRRFKENIIHFELEIYKEKYFKEIITNDIEFFKKEFHLKYGCKK